MLTYSILEYARALLATSSTLRGSCVQYIRSWLSLCSEYIPPTEWSSLSSSVDQDALDDSQSEVLRLATCRRFLSTWSQSLCSANSPTTWTAGRHSTCSIPGDSHRQTELRISIYVQVGKTGLSSVVMTTTINFLIVLPVMQPALVTSAAAYWAWTAIQSSWIVTEPTTIGFLDVSLFSVTKTLLWQCCTKTDLLYLQSVVKLTRLTRTTTVSCWTRKLR